MTRRCADDRQGHHEHRVLRAEVTVVFAPALVVGRVAIAMPLNWLAEGGFNRDAFQEPEISLLDRTVAQVPVLHCAIHSAGPPPSPDHHVKECAIS